MAIAEPARVPERRTGDAKIVLRLYVAGSAPNSLTAIANTRTFCDEHFAAGYDLEIVDMLANPQRALADGIVVTPTLVRLLPLPIKRLIGNLSDTTQMRMALVGR
jgi:circadian clock protein KaiB